VPENADRAEGAATEEQAAGPRPGAPELGDKVKGWLGSVAEAASGLLAQMVGAQSWIPATDVCHTSTEVVVLADLPGVRAEDVQTSAGATTITITGALAEPDLGPDCVYEQRGRQRGRFEKTISLQREILHGSGDITARLRNGVLEIRAPLAVPGAADARTEISVESESSDA